ncbi:DUF1269 domain-containing protein [Streptomyces sp. NPDC058664]|uniref:DUF1269 domain-containing protein n=1 Tax=Streptomyces sp. NPDC058664 TaxID=3346585 RepID=UPI00364F829D
MAAVRHARTQLTGGAHGHVDRLEVRLARRGRRRREHAPGTAEAGAHQGARRGHGQLAGGGVEAEDEAAEQSHRRRSPLGHLLGHALRPALLHAAVGAAVGAAAGALGGKMADVGIDDDFIDSVKSKVTPGTSALFLLSQDAVVDRVREAFPGGHSELLRSNLDREQEDKLREVFSH